MCGRYYLEDEIEDRRLEEQIKQATHVSAQICANMKTSGEIRPTDIAPVIAPSAAHRKMGAFPMQWGFNHPTKGMLVFNTRSETAEEKALFCTSINDRRCLIPASCYYEWHKIDKNKKISTLSMLRIVNHCTSLGCTLKHLINSDCPASPY